MELGAGGAVFMPLGELAAGKAVAEFFCGWAHETTKIEPMSRTMPKDFIL
jgi:hypothetical protein